MFGQGLLLKRLRLRVLFHDALRLRLLNEKFGPVNRASAEMAAGYGQG